MNILSNNFYKQPTNKYAVRTELPGSRACHVCSLNWKLTNYLKPALKTFRHQRSGLEFL